MHIIYGFLDGPLSTLEQLNLSSIHLGVQRVLMLRPDTPPPALPPDLKTLVVQAPNVVIPGQETTYWCFIQKLPENMPKNHIVMVIILPNGRKHEVCVCVGLRRRLCVESFEPNLTIPALSLLSASTSLHICQYESVITAGNEAIVHHMEVFQCSPDVQNVPDYSGSCDDKMKPSKLNSCRHVLAAWAMGAEVRRLSFLNSSQKDETLGKQCFCLCTLVTNLPSPLSEMIVRSQDRTIALNTRPFISTISDV